MDTSIKFYVWVHPKVRKDDLPNLPPKLKDDFDELFLKVLATDPYTRRGLPGHSLERELDGHDTIDIKYLGEAYRIVYRIDDRPQAMRVDLYSFDRHDSAYDKAKSRMLGWK